MPNIKKFLLLPVCLLFIAATFSGDGDYYFKISKSIDIFGKIYKEVSFNYVDQLDPEEFMVSGIEGMLASLDPYTTYIDEKGKEDIDLLTNGKYGGIGVSIGLRNDKITIVDLIEGYPAQRQGVRIGDIILKVNQVEINKDNFDDISKHVKGEPGSAVSLTIQREGVKESLIFNLNREEIKINNLSYYGFYPENSGNAYLKLSGFSRTAGDEVKKALNELRKQRDISTVVLDLRGNPGGLLDAAVDVCEKFLKKDQLVVSVIGRDTNNVKKYYSTEEPLAANVRLAVLVDNGSASASEIVAGAIQDHDRGIILGTDTFGKGLVQTIIPLAYNTSLKITTAKYYTPSGRCIQKIDYSRKDKLQNKSGLISGGEFRTDNNRPVFSAGGIKPDSVVKTNTDSRIVQDLLAKGYFFKFANYYFNENPKSQLNDIKQNAFYKEFLSFLGKEKYEYTTQAEKQLKDLIKTSEEEKYEQSLLDEMKGLLKKCKDLKDSELEQHRKEIALCIKMELMQRYQGHSGRIREALSTDKQFDIAYNILKNEQQYKKLLRK